MYFVQNIFFLPGGIFKFRFVGHQAFPSGEGALPERSEGMKGGRGQYVLAHLHVARRGGTALFRPSVLRIRSGGPPSPKGKAFCGLPPPYYGGAVQHPVKSKFEQLNYAL